MPTLIVSSAAMAAVAPSASAPPRAAPAARRNIRLVNDIVQPRRLRPFDEGGGNSTPMGAGADFATSVPANPQGFAWAGAEKSSGGAEELVKWRRASNARAPQASAAR